MSLTGKQNNTSTGRTITADQTDFDTLFDQHWDRICGVLYRLTGNWAEAQDLALETFLRLYQRPPKRNQNLGGWLYRVATNLGFNAIRSGKRRQYYEEQAGMVEFTNLQPEDPESALERLQEQEQVRMTLTRMKHRSAKLLILRHSGLSYAEVAKALELSPGSVGTLLARAEREFEKLYR